MPAFRELPEKVNILIARLSYSGYERVEIANWLVQTAVALNSHPRVNNVLHKIVTGYPTSRVRNQMMKLCRDKGVHFLVMIDDDMVPDVHSPDRCVSFAYKQDGAEIDPLPKMRDQCNFFPAVLDFALEHPGPCVIGAPYCAGPPEERVLVSRFRERASDDPNSACGGLQLECFTRDEAALRTGFEMVSALPTGLILIDMRVCDVLKPPYFDYEYADVDCSELASTEDTVFSRNAMYIGVPQYCVWQSWACHVKTRHVGRPRKYPGAAVPAQIFDAVRDSIERERAAARPADKVNEKAKRLLLRYDAENDDVPPVVPLEEESFPLPASRCGTLSPEEVAERNAVLRMGDDHNGGEGG